MRKSLLRRTALALGATTLALGIGTSQVASAAPTAPATPAAPTAPTPIDGWDVDATTHVGGLVATDVMIPQGSFTGSADFTAKTLGGDLSLPPATFSFNLFGLLPISVEFNVDATADTTGTVDLAAGTVTAHHTFDIRLSQLNLFGFLPLLDATTVCKTVTPITADLTGTVSSTLAVHLTGNYAIPAFQGCGLFNDIVTLSTSNPDNTLDVTIAPPAA
jgi:hypothetical protein